MKRLKITLITVLVLGAVVAILMYNKSTRAAQLRSDMLTEVPVSVTTVTRQKLEETLSLVGTVAANNDVSVISETQGRITSVRVKVGDFVPAGAVLVQVDDELKRAAYGSAEVNYEKAKKDFERYQALYEKRSITASQFDGARLALKGAESQFIVARRQLNDTRITTPIAGYVSARPVDLGTMVQNGTPVANVVDISTLKVKLNVAERDAFRLHAGDAVEVSTEVYPGVTFSGKIVSVAAKADEAHTYPVEIQLPNSKEHQLKAGMFARASFISIGGEPVLTVPRAALVGSIRQAQLYVVKGGAARLRDVVVGSSAGDTLGIAEGVAEGDTVVVNGQNNLRDNVAVAVVR